MTNIHHEPTLSWDNIENVEKHYSSKDKVKVSYTFTSALPNLNRLFAMDIFYRDAKHPKFGNRYFGIYHDHKGVAYITDADRIDGYEIGMIWDEKINAYRYSRHAHDFIQTEDATIDGGRDYIRGYNITIFTMKDGKLIKNKEFDYGEESQKISADENIQRKND